LRFRGGEIDAAISVHAPGGGEVKIVERHSPRGLGGKNPERLAEDGVILHFHLVAIAVNEEGGRRRCFGRGRPRRRGGTEVPPSLILAHHFNFIGQVADLRGEWTVLFRFDRGRGRLVGLVP